MASVALCPDLCYNAGQRMASRYECLAVFLSATTHLACEALQHDGGLSFNDVRILWFPWPGAQRPVHLVHLAAVLEHNLQKIKWKAKQGIRRCMIAILDCSGLQPWAQLAAS